MLVATEKIRFTMDTKWSATSWSWDNKNYLQSEAEPGQGGPSPKLRRDGGGDMNDT